MAGQGATSAVCLVARPIFRTTLKTNLTPPDSDIGFQYGDGTHAPGVCGKSLRLRHGSRSRWRDFPSTCAGSGDAMCVSFSLVSVGLRVRAPGRDTIDGRSGMKFLTHVKQFLASEDGPTAVEYAVMLALIIVVCLTAISAIGTNANATFQSVASKLPSGS